MILTAAGPSFASTTGTVVTVASLAITAIWVWFLFSRADRVPGSN